MLIEIQIPGFSDHSLMAGLSNDDHPQYVLANGSRSMDSLAVSGSIEADDIISSGTAVRLSLDDVSGSVKFYSDAWIQGDLVIDGDLLTNTILSDGLLTIDTDVLFPTGHAMIFGDGFNVGIVWDQAYNYLDFSGANVNFSNDLQANGTITAFKSGGLSNDWISIGHDGSNGNIDVGSGSVYLNDTLNVTGNLNVDSIYSYNAGDLELIAYDYVVAYNLYAPDGIDFDDFNLCSIGFSNFSIAFTSGSGFNFSGGAIKSNGGYQSSDGNTGTTESVDFSDGTMYFEDGLLVYVYIF